MKILVTGAAGFIGAAVSNALAKRGEQVLGIDNLNDYYSPALKQARLDLLKNFENFAFQKIDLADSVAIRSLFTSEKFDAVVHLGAQAGVRYSLENPQAYIDSNITGTLNILESCRHCPVQHLIYASSSSVYGDNAKIPFSVEDRTDNPVSLYAATKKSNELMVSTYTHLFGIQATGLRFFTVYGPWGRPDMAPMLFAKSILEGKPIRVFNHGNMRRDFTYIDDIVEGVVRTLDSRVPGIFNIGRGEPVDLMRFIEILDTELRRGRPACLPLQMEFLPMQPGDVPATWADTTALEKATGYRPKTSLEEGIKHFAKWHLEYEEKA